MGKAKKRKKQEKVSPPKKPFFVVYEPKEGETTPNQPQKGSFYAANNLRKDSRAHRTSQRERTAARAGRRGEKYGNP